MITNTTEIKQIVQRAIERGLIKPRQDRELTTSAYLAKNRRARFHAMGLTSTGRKPAARKLQQFAGLVGREYHKAYMRAWRAAKVNQ